MIHIVGFLLEMALLDMGAIDAKLAKWMTKEVWLEVRGVTGQEVQEDMLEILEDPVHALTQPVCTAELRWSVIRGCFAFPLPLLRQTGNFTACSKVNQGSVLFSHPRTWKLEICPSVVGCLCAESCSNSLIAKNQVKRCPTLWMPLFRKPVWRHLARDVILFFRYCTKI